MFLLYKNDGMEYVIIALTVLIGAALTFFSGFGLGTLMLPVFSLFFPLPIAIGATAVVHLANNIFKFGLVYKHIHLPTLIRFGVPAMIFAIIGSLLLGYFEDLEVLTSYTLYGKTMEITMMKVIIGSLMIFFAWFDLDPRFSNLQVDKKYIPLGGILSGFFGGISGHQGAFRSAFLTKAGLSKEQFIGTSNSIALIIDISRIYIYIKTLDLVALSEEYGLLGVGIIFAFTGTYFGKELLKKTTLAGIQKVVGAMLLVLGALFVSGIL